MYNSVKAMLHILGHTHNSDIRRLGVKTFYNSETNTIQSNILKEHEFCTSSSYLICLAYNLFNGITIKKVHDFYTIVRHLDINNRKVVKEAIMIYLEE